MTRSLAVRALGVVAGVAIGLAVLLLLMMVRHQPGVKTPADAVAINWARPIVDADGLAQRSGVRVSLVAVTGAGGLVDLRYQVLDPNAASAVHDPANPPAVVDERTGLVVQNLLMNHAHSGAYRAGATYYLVFENPGNWVRRGAKVTVLLGNARLEHVTVR